MSSLEHYFAQQREKEVQGKANAFASYNQGICCKNEVMSVEREEELQVDVCAHIDRKPQSSRFTS